MKSLRQRASPWGRPFRNLIGSDVSGPCFVVATTLVFQLLLNFSTPLDNQAGNLFQNHHVLQPTMVYRVVRLLDFGPRHTQVTLSPMTI